MPSTRNALKQIEANVDESMGVRVRQQKGELEPQFSPVPSAKDVGRLPLRGFGRVEIDRIIPDPAQPRSKFDRDDLEHLAKSIRETGQLQPIRINWDEQRGKWVIISGERRWRAAKAAGVGHVDCCFDEDGISHAQRLQQQLTENLLRQDLQPLEEARGYQALMEFKGFNGKQVAEFLNVSPSRVSRALALLDLPADVQEKIESGVIARTAAYELTKLADESAQKNVATRAEQGKLTHRQTAGAVRQRQGKKSRKPCGIHQVFQAGNGIKVTVSAKRKGNYRQIEEALEQALDEVRLRIKSNIQLF